MTLPDSITQTDDCVLPEESVHRNSPKKEETFTSDPGTGVVKDEVEREVKSVSDTSPYTSQPERQLLITTSRNFARKQMTMM